MFDDGFVLAVVEVDGDGDAGLLGGEGGGVHEEAIGVGYGPREELDDKRGALSLGGLDKA